MATAMQPRARELLEEGGKIAQGVPDQRDLNKFVKLLRYFNRQSKLIDQSSTPAHTAIARKRPGLTVAAIPPVSTETHPPADSDIIRTTKVTEPLVSGSGPKLGPDFQVANSVGLGGMGTSAADRESEPQHTRSEAVTTSTTITNPGDFALNLDTAEDRAIDPVILGEEHRITSEPNPVVASANLDTTVSPSQQKQAQKGPELPRFKFIGGQSQQLGKRRIWRKVQAFTTLGGENLYLATNLSPGAEYTKQWEEKWEPTLRAETWDLSIDQNDIFTFDLRMAGQSPDQLSMKPTILIICNESHKSTIESKLNMLVKQTVPKEVCFRVVGRRVTLASGGETGDFAKPGLTVDTKKRGWNNYHTMMGSAALIHEGPSMEWKSGFALSTIGGLIAVGNSLYALTTAHSMFQKPLSDPHEMQMSGMLESCGKVEQFKWSNMPMKKMGQDTQGLFGSTRTPMDWALISVLDKHVLPNNFIDNTYAIRCSVHGFMRNKEFPAVEEVWICSGTAMSGMLSNTVTTVVVGNVAFRAHTVSLEHCLVDGHSGSWVISQTTHKLCGYIFAKVDGMELGYMLPIEPVLDDISREMSKDTKVDVEVPDPETISRLVELMKRKSKETENQPEVLSRPSLEPTSTPATTPSADMPESSRSAARAEHVENWQSSMYKPDSRLPPDHQLPPTALKRLQEQGEKEGDFRNVYDTSFQPPSDEGFNHPSDPPTQTKERPPTPPGWNNRSPPPPSRPAPVLPTQEITSSPSHRSIPPLSPHLKLLADEIFRNDEIQPVPRSDVDLPTIHEPERPPLIGPPVCDPGPTPGSRVEMSEIRSPGLSLFQHISKPRPVDVDVNPPHSRDPVQIADNEDHRIRISKPGPDQPRADLSGSQFDPRRRSRRLSTSFVLASVVILILLSISAGFGYLGYWIIKKSPLSNGGKGGTVFAVVSGWLSLLLGLWSLVRYKKRLAGPVEPESPVAPSPVAVPEMSARYRIPEYGLRGLEPALPAMRSEGFHELGGAFPAELETLSEPVYEVPARGRWGSELP